MFESLISISIPSFWYSFVGLGATEGPPKETVTCSDDWKYGEIFKDNRDDLKADGEDELSNWDDDEDDDNDDNGVVKNDGDGKSCNDDKDEVKADDDNNDDDDDDDDDDDNDGGDDDDDDEEDQSDDSDDEANEYNDDNEGGLSVDNIDDNNTFDFWELCRSNEAYTMVWNGVLFCDSDVLRGETKLEDLVTLCNIVHED